MKKADRLNKRYDELNFNSYYITVRDQQMHSITHRLNTVTGFILDVDDDNFHFDTDDMKYMVFSVNNLPQPFRKKF